MYLRSLKRNHTEMESEGEPDLGSDHSSERKWQKESWVVVEGGVAAE